VSDKEYLTAQETHQLTGFARAAQQSEWLKLNGIPHKPFERHVVVSQVHVRAWLEGRAIVSSNGPDFSRINDRLKRA